MTVLFGTKQGIFLHDFIHHVGDHLVCQWHAECRHLVPRGTVSWHLIDKVGGNLQIRWPASPFLDDAEENSQLQARRLSSQRGCLLSMSLIFIKLGVGCSLIPSILCYSGFSKTHTLQTAGLDFVIWMLSSPPVRRAHCDIFRENESPQKWMFEETNYDFFLAFKMILNINIKECGFQFPKQPRLVLTSCSSCLHQSHVWYNRSVPTQFNDIENPNQQGV